MKKPKTVMLIDDDTPTNFLHEIVLSEVRPIENIIVYDYAEEALNYLLQTDEHPELIFLDINMPRMDGWEFIENYENLENIKNKSIIVVMLTTSINPDDEKKASNYKCINRFENKPLTPEKAENIFKNIFS